MELADVRLQFSQLVGAAEQEQPVNAIDGDIVPELRSLRLENGVAPAFYFNPVLPGMTIDRTARPLRRSPSRRVSRPPGAEDVAYLPGRIFAN